MTMIYLDNAATSLKKPHNVEKAIIHALHITGNAGRGAHAVTLDTARLLYDTRKKLADFIKAESPDRIAFTSNATEALNMALFGFFKSGDHVITTVCEHNSVLRPLYVLESQGVSITYIGADSKGNIEYNAIKKSCRANTKAIIITHASNVTGNVTDIELVGRIAKEKQILLIVDASQSIGILPIDVGSVGIDVLCFSGHKSLLGPQGTGGIYIRKGISIRPIIVGGIGSHSYDKEHPQQMPEVLEAGTQNGHGIAGLGAALDYINDRGLQAIYDREMVLANRFLKGISTISNLKLYGDYERMRVPIVTLNIRNYDSSKVSDVLWEEYEIATRAGAHCAPLMHQALGTVDQGAVRFSFSHFNTKQEIDIAIEAVSRVAKE